MLVEEVLLDEEGQAVAPPEVEGDTGRGVARDEAVPVVLGILLEVAPADEEDADREVPVGRREAALVVDVEDLVERGPNAGLPRVPVCARDVARLDGGEEERPLAGLGVRPDRRGVDAVLADADLGLGEGLQAHREEEVGDEHVELAGLAEEGDVLAEEEPHGVGRGAAARSRQWCLFMR
ncbi:MAG: hypothetical protein AAGK21_00145 [Bacteroidota bacterium]